MARVLASLLAVLALVVAGCGGSNEAAVTLVSPAEASELIAGGEVRVLDVRTPEEYAAGHIEGATLIDFYEPDFAERIGELDRDEEYVVYCRSGNRSSQATALMGEQGFGDVNDVDGGIVAWEAAGLPVSR